MRRSLFDDDDEPPAAEAVDASTLDRIQTLMWMKGQQGQGWYARNRNPGSVFHYHPTNPLEACKKATQGNIRKRLL